MSKIFVLRRCAGIALVRSSRSRRELAAQSHRAYRRCISDNPSSGGRKTSAIVGPDAVTRALQIDHAWGQAPAQFIPSVSLSHGLTLRPWFVRKKHQSHPINPRRGLPHKEKEQMFDFDNKREGTGTREWAEISENIARGSRTTVCTAKAQNAALRLASVRTGPVRN